MVRGKFVLTSMTQMSGSQARSLKFTTQYDPTIPEDQKYAKATPSGELTMYVDNPPALAQLELGKAYYLDLTEVPAPETPAA